MADFRKWFLAFAVIAVLSSLSVPAFAQGQASAFTCSVAGVPVVGRVEGITELVGDLVLDCTGGTPTPFGQPVPTANIQIFLGPTNVNITSRIEPGGAASTNAPFNEALLLVDEPGRPGNAGQLPCGSSTTAGTPGVETFPNSGVCTIFGTGSGVNTYGAPGATNVPNIFQGRYTNYNGSAGPTPQNNLSFLGVPIDPPGTSGHRIIRITNVRANLTNLGSSATNLIFQPVTEFITITGTQNLPVQTYSQTVAFAQPGLLNFPGSTPTPNATQTVTAFQTFQQCSAPAPGNFTVTAWEGFASAWKPRNYSEVLLNSTTGAGTGVIYNPGSANPGTDLATGATGNTTGVSGAQNVPQFPYFTETGFYNPSFTTNHGLNDAGRADQGTRLQFTFRNVPAGSRLTFPAAVNTFSANSTTTANPTGVAILVGTSPTTTIASSTTIAPASDGTITVTYEFLYNDSGSIDRLPLPVVLSYTPALGSNTPTPFLTTTVETNFSPQSTIVVPTDPSQVAIGPQYRIPRFSNRAVPSNVFTINKCNCNLLFPFVTTDAGFDTGVAIANTTLDPFGDPRTSPAGQSGGVTVYFYNGTSTAPASQITRTSTGTARDVKAGEVMTFSLGSTTSVGSHGITGIGTGFTGYIIATAQFQFCHGFAFLSQFGQPFSGSEGYLGIVLDTGTLNRTGIAGEAQGH